MYKVLKTFRDLQDSKATKTGTIYHRYLVGDRYPREGANPSPERIAELAGTNNRMGCPLIAPIESAAPAAEPVGEVVEPADDVKLEDMLKKELAELAESRGIEIPAKATKGEIIALIQAQ